MLGENIKALRKDHHLTLQALADNLNKKYPKTVNFNKGKLSKWENGREEPKLSSVKILADYFETTVDSLVNGKLEAPILSVYNKLHEPRQRKVLTFAQDQLDEQEGRVEEKILSYYTLICNGAVSAGTGEWLEDEVKEEITISADKVPSSPYDLVLRVNGDSMEPLFQNHEYIFVRKTMEIRNGQIGVFIVDNEAYLKKAYIEKDHLRLVSLNKAYDDLLFNSLNDIKVVGVVVM